MIITSSTPPLTAFSPAQRLFDLMQKDFKMSLKNRLFIIPEVNQYRIKEDQSIYDQVKNSKYDYEVYFDAEFVCGVSNSDHPQRARINILLGLKKLFLEKKIFWDKKQYEINERIERDNQAREKARKEARRKKPKTKEEKLVDIGVRKALQLDK